MLWVERIFLEEKAGFPLLRLFLPSLPDRFTMASFASRNGEGFGHKPSKPSKDTQRLPDPQISNAEYDENLQPASRNVISQEGLDQQDSQRQILIDSNAHGSLDQGNVQNQSLRGKGDDRDAYSEKWTLPQ